MGETVLVIDDDPAIHKVVEAHLSSWRVDFVNASNGEMGLDAAASRNPDLILLDVDMPGISGHEVCRLLKADPQTRGIPVVFLTASDSTEQKVLALEMGAVDYVTKPFDPFELHARAKAALRSKRHTDFLTSRAMIDELTGLFTRALFERHLGAELARARRSALPLSCIILEVDRFDQIVDEYGGAGGEDVLVHTARDLEKTFRREDILCRYGEAQFAVLGSSKTSETMTRVAERLRKTIRSRPIVCGAGATRMTGSIGIATSRFSFGHSIVTEAENALQRARDSGGDCVELGGELVELRLAS